LFYCRIQYGIWSGNLSMFQFGHFDYYSNATSSVLMLYFIRVACGTWWAELPYGTSHVFFFREPYYWCSKRWLRIMIVLAICFVVADVFSPILFLSDCKSLMVYSACTVLENDCNILPIYFSVLNCASDSFPQCVCWCWFDGIGTGNPLWKCGARSWRKMSKCLSVYYPCWSILLSIRNLNEAWPKNLTHIFTDSFPLFKFSTIL